jgi:predicted Zn-dependent protease with MMP-like domain
VPSVNGGRADALFAGSHPRRAASRATPTPIRSCSLLPDEIAVFRGPINRVSRTRQEAVQQVCETVIYELGRHYFGLDDGEMPH